MAGRHGLGARRKALGLTQESLAEQLRVERSTVARWEQGTATPRPRRPAPQPPTQPIGRVARPVPAGPSRFGATAWSY